MRLPNDSNNNNNSSNNSSNKNHNNNNINNDTNNSNNKNNGNNNNNNLNTNKNNNTNSSKNIILLLSLLSFTRNPARLGQVHHSPREPSAQPRHGRIPLIELLGKNMEDMEKRLLGPWRSAP